MCYIHTNHGGRYPDIDPFTFFGIFSIVETALRNGKDSSFLQRTIGLKPSAWKLWGIPIVFGSNVVLLVAKILILIIQPL